MKSAAQVVYYLSRGGRLEQPHLIEVELAGNALRLRDVKARLVALRGKDMPDSFSWAYKRSYKNDFIWNDVTEDDIILPLGSEYILKASENVYGAQQENRSPGTTQRAGTRTSTLAHRSPTNVLGQPRGSEMYERNTSPRSSIADSRSPRSHPRDSFNSEVTALRVNRQLMDSLALVKSECITGDETCREHNPHTDGYTNVKVTDVKVYKTPASPVTADHGTDAATQTEEEQPHEMEFQSSRKPEKVCFALKKQPEMDAGRMKQTTMLRQLLSCGGIDTNTCPSMQHNRQAPSYGWVKSKSDRVHEPESVAKISMDLPTFDSFSLTERPSFSHGNQDPESMPEVVKETTCFANLDVTPKPNTPTTFLVVDKRSANKTPGNAAARDGSHKVPGHRVPPKADDGSSGLGMKRQSLNQEHVKLAHEGQFKSRDDRPLTPGRSRLDWERTLQESVNSSTPPVNFRQTLQQCPECGRTFKSDSLKVHLRSCHVQRLAPMSNVARRLQ